MIARLVPVFLLALVFLGAPPAQAPARAQSLYTVSGVHVDVIAASSAEAFNAAIAKGRPMAWQRLYRRLTRQQDWARQPALDAATLGRLSQGYSVANERRSTTRYVADVTYTFNPTAVARLLRGANIAFTQVQARRILVVAMSPAFANGPWASALAAPTLSDPVLPFTVAGAEDAPTLGKLDFAAAAWSDVAPAARRINATEAALVQVVYADGKVTVNIRRLGLGQTPTDTHVDVPLQQTLATTYPIAAQAAVAAMEDLWKARAVVNFNTRGTLTADVSLTSLAQWGAIQTALAGIDTVTQVQLLAMDLHYARLSVSYSGSPDQLREALADKRLILANHGGHWTITGSH